MIRFLRQLREFLLALPSWPEKESASSVRAQNIRDKAMLDRWADHPGYKYFEREVRATGGSDSNGGGFVTRSEPWDPLLIELILRDLRGDVPTNTGEVQPHERSRICNMRWANATVLLGDTDFIRCRFFNCQLIDDGPFSMENCFVENCTIRTKDQHEKTHFRIPSFK
jgi:hypothetical protein